MTLLDSDGYPTEETLQKIREWDIKDREGVLRFIAECWYYEDSAQETREGLWVFATGGWSGNEELIYALQENRVLWIYLTSIYYLHLTGGFYVFAIKDKAQELLKKQEYKLTKWCWNREKNIEK